MSFIAYLQENDSSEQRLIDVVGKLSDTDYGADMGGGWTVATALVHLAFWDTCRLVLLERWQLTGASDAPSDSEIINVGVQALATAIPARAAGELAISAARDIDAELHKIPLELADAIEAAGQTTVLRRSVHRLSHLDDIAKALKPA